MVKTSFVFSPVRYVNYSYITFVQGLSLVFTTAPLSSRSLRFKCHLVHGQAGAQNLANWVSVGIGWGIGGLASKASKHAKHSCTPKTAPKPCLKLMPCLHHLKMDLYIGGVSVLGGPLSVVKDLVSRFKVQGDPLLLCSSTNLVGYLLN